MSSDGGLGKSKGRGSLISTLKRLLTNDRSSTRTLPYGSSSCDTPPTHGDTPGAPWHAGASQLDLGTNSIGSLGATAGGSLSPFNTSQLIQANNYQRYHSGPLAGTSAPPLLRAVFVATPKALQHSISDPYEKGPGAAPASPLIHMEDDHSGGWPPSTPQAWARSSARSPIRLDGASLPTLCDSPAGSRLFGPDSHAAVAISAPSSNSNNRGRLLAGVSLPSVEGRNGRSPLLQTSSSPVVPPSGANSSAVASPLEAPSSARTSSSMLLALCPSTPTAMRRKNWCLEDYDVSRRIYKSSTSAVYKATCRRSGLPVALKVYFLSRVPANVVHMIVREIKIQADLVHKNIIMLYGAFSDERRLVLVQEYAARGDLYGIHHAMHRRMTERQLTELVLVPFVDALAYLHSRGICHRDIKPENILFTQDWRLVIADFGVSINLKHERAVTRAGTQEYMAPEVERCPLKMLPEENKDQNSLAYTTAVDVWATGVLSYELLVGFPPFVADHATQKDTGAFLVEQATSKTLSFPSSTSPGARDFIGWALAERPEERPTALQMRDHPWLAAAAAAAAAAMAIAREQQAAQQAAQQPPARTSSSQLAALSATPLTPTRLSSASAASPSATSAPVPIPGASALR